MTTQEAYEAYGAGAGVIPQGVTLSWKGNRVVRIVLTKRKTFPFDVYMKAPGMRSKGTFAGHCQLDMAEEPHGD